MLNPLAQQCGLAKAGRGGDERVLAVKALVQPFNHAWAWDDVGAVGDRVLWSGADLAVTALKNGLGLELDWKCITWDCMGGRG